MNSFYCAEHQEGEVHMMKKQHTIIARFAGLSALVIMAAIVTSCGGGDGPSGTTATLPAAASLATPITAVLSGAQEVPPVATAGTGNAVLSVNFATGALSGTVSFSGLSSVAVAAHIHQGAAGVNGPIIIPLAGGIGLTSGTWTVPVGTVMTAAQLSALQAGGLYVQIHTQIFPAGEIRAQLAGS
jgi:hypothetical protein